jgi:hypothetical protein
MPIGTLSQKIQFQAMPSTTAPPTNGPSATPSPETPAQTPSAIPRWRPGKASESSVSVSGMTIAGPGPLQRAGGHERVDRRASAARALESVKTPRPMENIRLRPKRSPSAAPVMSSTAKVSV